MHARDVVVTDATTTTVQAQQPSLRERAYTRRRRCSGHDSLSNSDNSSDDERNRRHNSDNSNDHNDHGNDHDDADVQMTSVRPRTTATTVAHTSTNSSCDSDSLARTVAVIVAASPSSPPSLLPPRPPHLPSVPPHDSTTLSSSTATTTPAVAHLLAVSSTVSLSSALHDAGVASERAQQRSAEAAALAAATAVQLRVQRGGVYDVIAPATTQAMALADNYDVSVSDARHPNTFVTSNDNNNSSSNNDGSSNGSSSTTAVTRKHAVRHVACVREAYRVVRSLRLQGVLLLLYVVVLCILAFVHVLRHDNVAAWPLQLAAVVFAAEHGVLLAYMRTARFAEPHRGKRVVECVVVCSLVVFELVSWQLYTTTPSVPAWPAGGNTSVPASVAEQQQQQQRYQRAWQRYVFGKLAVVRLLLWCVHGLTRGEQLLLAVRCCCSGDRRRYQAEGADLDLCYIHRNLVAMAWPAHGLECAFRNPAHEVAALLDRKHARAYVVVNLCSERTYRPTPFHEQTWWYAMDDHNPCELAMMLRFCREASAFVLADVDARVVAVHCKGGKGRTGTMLCALLLYLGLQESAEAALEHFAQMRTVSGGGGGGGQLRRFQGVQTPSQGRYVRYFARLLGLPTRRCLVTHHDNNNTDNNSGGGLAVGGSAVRRSICSSTRRLSTVVPSRRVRVRALRLCGIPWLWYAHGVGKLWFAVVQKPCSERRVAFVSNAAVRFDAQLPDLSTYTTKQLCDLFASDEDNVYRECNRLDARELQDDDDDEDDNESSSSRRATTTTKSKQPRRQAYALDTASFWYYIAEDGPARMDYAAFMSALRRHSHNNDSNDNAATATASAAVPVAPRMRARDVPQLHVTLELRQPERVPVLQDDVVFKFYYARNNPSTLEAPVQFWLHTGFERDGVVQLPRSELDGPARDTQGERYPDDFAIQLDLVAAHCTTAAAAASTTAQSADDDDDDDGYDGSDSNNDDDVGNEDADSLTR